jgi:hypothetical protein
MRHRAGLKNKKRPTQKRLPTKNYGMNLPALKDKLDPQFSLAHGMLFRQQKTRKIMGLQGIVNLIKFHRKPPANNEK